MSVTQESTYIGLRISSFSFFGLDRASDLGGLWGAAYGLNSSIVWMVPGIDSRFHPFQIPEPLRNQGFTSIWNQESR